MSGNFEIWLQSTDKLLHYKIQLHIFCIGSKFGQHKIAIAQPWTELQVCFYYVIADLKVGE